MKFLLLLVGVCFAADHLRMYHKYVDDFGKEKSKYRFEVFKSNMEWIEKHNAKNLSWRAGINQFTDLTNDEFSDWVHKGGYRPDYYRKRDYTAWENLDIPKRNVTDGGSKDWTTEGAVTPVKNQGQCGSCWAFSTTGCLEGVYQIKNRNLQSFSEQELVDCDKVDSGCSGGLMDYGFEFAQKEGGLCTEESYGYNAVGGTCKKSSCNKVPFTINNIVDVPKDSTGSNLMSAVDKNPVSVAIEADRMVFQSYHDGVITSLLCGEQLDHGVLAVGYGTDGGEDYFKVKNSWGSSWGMNGYVLIGRANVCGINAQPSYAEM